MGKLEYLEIELENQREYYYGGETIRGRMIAKASEQFNFKGISIKLEGNSSLRFSQYQNQYTTIVYTNSEQYINTVKTLAREGLFQPGTQEFPFEFELPQNLPNSFQISSCSRAKIIYFIEGEIAIPSSLNKSCKKAFTVISNLDLNTSPRFLQMGSTTDTKIMGFGPFKSDPIIGTLTIPKIGYVCGERISFTVSIENKSGKDVESSVTLKRIVKLTGKSGKTRTLNKEMTTQIKCPFEVKRETSREWNGEITIPTVVPTIDPYVSLCKIIEVSYYLNLNFDASKLSRSKDVQVPIIIGTVPIAGYKHSKVIYTADSFGSRPDLSKKNNEKGDDDFSEYVPIYPRFE